MTWETGAAGAGEDAAPGPRVIPFGDAAVIAEFGDRVDRALSAQVIALDRALAAAPPEGLIETTPTFRSLLVVFDPLRTDHDAMADAIARAAQGAPFGAPLGAPLGAEASSEARSARLWRFPACYETAVAPDLREVSEETGLSEDAVVAAHLAVEHHVYMLGFLPGAPYLGDLPPQIDLPRRQEPRVSVPAGSVAIAVGLTVIYPVQSPGGWRLIGRTPARLFDLAASEPALLAPGDAIRFEPVSLERLEALGAAADAGEWTPDWSQRT